MKNTKEEIALRIHQLKQKNPVANAKIINKLQRMLRMMEGNNNENI